MHEKYVDGGAETFAGMQSVANDANLIFKIHIDVAGVLCSVVLDAQTFSRICELKTTTSTEAPLKELLINLFETIIPYGWTSARGICDRAQFLFSGLAATNGYIRCNDRRERGKER